MIVVIKQIALFERIEGTSLVRLKYIIWAGLNRITKAGIQRWSYDGCYFGFFSYDLFCQSISKYCRMDTDDYFQVLVHIIDSFHCWFDYET